jgi:hypothetical protein
MESVPLFVHLLFHISYLYKYIYRYDFKYTHNHIYTFVYTCINIHMHIHTYFSYCKMKISSLVFTVYMRFYISYLHICIYIWYKIHTYSYICIDIYIYIHIHTVIARWKLVPLFLRSICASIFPGDLFLFVLFQLSHKKTLRWE